MSGAALEGKVFVKKFLCVFLFPHTEVLLEPFTLSFTARLLSASLLSVSTLRIDASTYIYLCAAYSLNPCWFLTPTQLEQEKHRQNEGSVTTTRLGKGSDSTLLLLPLSLMLCLFLPFAFNSFSNFFCQRFSLLIVFLQFSSIVLRIPLHFFPSTSATFYLFKFNI